MIFVVLEKLYYRVSKGTMMDINKEKKSIKYILT